VKGIHYRIMRICINIENRSLITYLVLAKFDFFAPHQHYYTSINIIRMISVIKVSPKTEHSAIHMCSVHTLQQSTQIHVLEHFNTQFIGKLESESNGDAKVCVRNTAWFQNKIYTLLFTTFAGHSCLIHTSRPTVNWNM
jgi:hypothetical protein